LSIPSKPVLHNLSGESEWLCFESNTEDELAFVCQMFCSRLNDTKNRVTQYLGSCVVDVSTLKSKEYSFVVRDCSSHPPLRTGQISIQFKIPELSLNHLSVQNANFSREMYSAAESNLTWIHGFSPKGFRPIAHGLHYVHSPYYVNHMGVTMPSGSFCMIPTTIEDDFTKAVRSHKQRFLISLARNCMTSEHWLKCISEMFNSSIKSRHLRCLAVVADTLTLHARMNIYYTPDVQITPTPKGTERWEIPREPTMDGNLSFTGDCEDFSREVYQQCKELCQWIQPNYKTLMGMLSAVLHMYIPTIEQGAVDSSAHSKYITYEAPYRNHIWAALHPRHAWRTKMHGHISLKDLYTKWPEHPCEKTLPLLHLEGTGEVYPVVTCRKPSYIARMKCLGDSIPIKYSCVSGTVTPDMSIQCNHRSNFYKYAIAFMTDIFSSQGVLDYTYTTKNTYGVSIYDWARGHYQFRPSTHHSPQTMRKIQKMIHLERPIFPIDTESQIVKGPAQQNGYFLRYGDSKPIDYPEICRYQIGDKSWYEIYFKVDENGGSSSEIELSKT
jgi:hypothetical protein